MQRDYNGYKYHSFKKVLKSKKKKLALTSLYCDAKDTLKAFDDFKNKQQKCMK